MVLSQLSRDYSEIVSCLWEDLLIGYFLFSQVRAYLVVLLMKEGFSGVQKAQHPNVYKASNILHSG